MDIGERLRLLREAKDLSQGDIEKSTGLLRCYISRVENGHTVPALDTLRKLSDAVGVQFYQLFYGAEEPAADPSVSRKGTPDWASQGKGARYFTKLRRAISRMSDHDRALLLSTAQKMVAPRPHRPSA